MLTELKQRKVLIMSKKKKNRKVKVTTVSRALENGNGKLFGVRYPDAVLAAWHRVHGNQSHEMDVTRAYAFLYPDRPQNISREEKEMRLRRRAGVGGPYTDNWTCGCPGAQEVVDVARAGGNYAYYF
jgi:hypothetical protein